MKTKLPSQSQEHETRIREIADIIFKTAGDKIAFVILFGSFARGNWVRDRYVEDHIIYEYASDYDFLIITKPKSQLNGTSSFDLRRKIEREIYLNGLDAIHKSHLIVEPLDYINSELEKSQYFFKDIKEEGILFYEDKDFKLAETRELSEVERGQIAKDNYDHWFGKAKNFLITFKTMFDLKQYSDAAFLLHQATESFYKCSLLVLTGYKPKSHDLKELNSLAASQNNQFLIIFPLATKEQKDCFELLQKAYIEARYNKNYKITKEQLEYLVGRVERLREVVKGVCEEGSKPSSVG